MSDAIAERLIELLDAHQPFSLATVVATHGDVPCRPGDKLIVHASGEREGSLGSTALEEAVARAALDRLSEEAVAVVRFGAQGKPLPPRRGLRTATDA